MAKVFAILVGVAAAAGGATYALFSYAHPYRCHLSDCEVATQKCCSHDADVCPEASLDATMAVAGPVALFTEQGVSTPACCATVRVTPAATAACCVPALPCCATVSACCANGPLAAVVGPAAAR